MKEVISLQSATFKTDGIHGNYVTVGASDTGAGALHLRCDIIRTIKLAVAVPIKVGKFVLSLLHRGKHPGNGGATLRPYTRPPGYSRLKPIKALQSHVKDWFCIRVAAFHTRPTLARGNICLSPHIVGPAVCHPPIILTASTR